MALFSQGSITADEVMEDLDRARDLVLSQEDTMAEAQIGLCKANAKAGGCMFKIYKGELAMGGGGNISINRKIVLIARPIVE